MDKTQKRNFMRVKQAGDSGGAAEEICGEIKKREEGDKVDFCLDYVFKYIKVFSVRICLQI